MEFYCRATGPVLTADDGLVYHIACAIDIANQVPLLDPGPSWVGA
jgi:hypothetical protein